MPQVLKRNAFIVFGLGSLFYWSFMFAKHNPALRDVIPFGDDPYDAVGSFGVIVGMLIALLSLIRAFRPYREAPSSTRRAYLVGPREAVVLVVFMTLASDVSMAHFILPCGFAAASRDKLIALVGGMLVATVAMQCSSAPRREASGARRPETGKRLRVPPYWQ